MVTTASQVPRLLASLRACPIYRYPCDGLCTREIAAAEYAAHGNLATARERMADAPDPANAGKSPAAQMSPELLKVKAEPLGVKAGARAVAGRRLDKAYTDSWVWSDATDALEAGAGNPQVRAGVLRLLSTVSGGSPGLQSPTSPRASSKSVPPTPPPEPGRERKNHRPFGRKILAYLSNGRWRRFPPGDQPGAMSTKRL
jgi:hypothetical protein